jgi:hypothetical protein
MMDARNPTTSQILSNQGFEYLWEVFARDVRRVDHTAGVIWPCNSNGTGGIACFEERYKTISLEVLCGKEYAAEYPASIVAVDRIESNSCNRVSVGVTASGHC